ncbi:unnamed protein product (macronuclear) [Paramecium tetraurelia]|uniref:PX domain-containing protein n=1 Tax=Paramecium tetraurelia TaxID=5888 RepID=A0DU53_PARTE|nr:uncharacterized protein GSPATT00020241001 [Paramecium tetraurelia]CAK86570.1 unnamed protein product [Paramecium tetraurelia]|eukprot:XP_001453967.1 hypothetical protein (macronuclear) [Paramecium tetraurelia strain d4-2]
MSLEQKQNLLVKEIIDKGFNIDNFQKFIDQRHDLEEWDYDELVEVIKKFQDQQNDYFQVLKCNRTIPNAISNSENLTSTVVGYEKVQKGIFMSTYVYFKIETKPINWVVRRTYEEFIALKNMLNKHYNVPNIPNQRKSPVEFTYIKQLRHLQMFLNFVLLDQEIRSLPVIQDFLSLDSFQPNQVIPFTTLSGDFGIRINKQIACFIKQSDYFLNNVSPLQKKAYKLVKQLMKNMQQQNQTMFQLSDVYKELFKESKAQNARLKDCYIIASHLFEQLSKIQTDNIKILNETIYAQQRFQFHQIAPLKDILNQREKHYNQVFDFSNKLKAKKEKLYQQGEVVKWDLDESYLDSFKLEQIKSTPQIAFQCMCKTDNSHLQVLKNQFGQINLRAYEAIESVIKYTSTQFKDHLEKFAQLMTTSIHQYQKLWSDTLENLAIS